MRRYRITGVVVREWLALMMVLASTGCAPDRPDPQAPRSVDPSGEIDAPVRWSTLLHESSEARSAVPRAFRVTGSALRVIIDIDDVRSPVAVAVVIANLLADSTALPVETLQFTRSPGDSVATDTTVIDVAPGRFHLYVPQAYGARSWRVLVQQPSEDRRL